MANNGPATNSSQFYYARCYTLARREAYHFGHVVEEGMNVVNLIEQTIISKKVIIIRKGEAAKKFNATKTFYDYSQFSLSIL
jgi:peptidylprolyl isomerase